MEVEVGEDVAAAVGARFQKVHVGMGGVVATHASEVAVGAQDGVGVLEVECSHEFGPCKGVEQAAEKQFASAVAVGQVLVEHEQIVAEVEIGLAGILGWE